MSNLIVRVFSNLSTRIMFLFYLSLILITAFFIIFGYYTQLDLQEKRQHEKLMGIVTTVALSIDGDDHEMMMQDHSEMDDIPNNDVNATYHHIHELLAETHQVNMLNSDLYTLVFNEEKEVFEFGVVSAESPYFRHEYMNFPPDLLKKMDEGGTIPLYESENGLFLSAFYPIRNKEGNTVGLVEADTEFTEFIADVRSKYWRQTFIALGVILGMALILIPYTRKVLKEDEKQKEQLLLQSQMIEEKNRDITDSINYALKIQNTILPQLSDFGDYFEDSFVLFKPKDIVAGDFYYLEKFGDYIYVAVADCTGHGVPGAMVSVICSNALTFAIHERKLTNTGEILDTAREVVVSKFKSSPDGIKDGMDISLCRFSTKDKSIQYSGANNPVYIISEGELEVVKPDKQPIGQFDHAEPFKSVELDIKAGDMLYLFSDGYADQFGGIKGKKFKYSSFRELLASMHGKDMDYQMQQVDDSFEEWRGDFEQLDDVCVIGIRV